MNVGELMIKLARLPSDLTVVMEQNDEPLGQYEVLDVDVCDATPDKLFHRDAPTYGGRTWDSPQVWHTYDSGDAQVVFLRSDKPWQPTIDSEIEQKEIEAR